MKRVMSSYLELIVALVIYGVIAATIAIYDLYSAIPWFSLLIIFSLIIGLLALELLEEKSVLQYIRRVSKRIQETAANRSAQHAARYVKEAALSVTFLNQVREQTALARTLLLIAIAGVIILTYVFGFQFIFFNASYVLLALYGLLLIKDAVLHYRVTHGLFGTNAYEAHVMIDFLLENAGKTDFTDGDGKLKQAFPPEQLREYNLRAEGQDVGVHA
jgi:hypothetical protein